MRKLSIQKLKGSISALGAAVNMVFSEPRILIPFLILAGFETLALVFLACSPHFPVSYIMVPPIRRLWGETYLHYPFFYELLPRLFYWAKLLLGVLVGCVTSGMAVVMVARFKNKEVVVLKDVFKVVWKRYITLLLLSVILFTVVHNVMIQSQPILAKILRGHLRLQSLGPKFWLTIFLPALQFLMAVVLQGLFVFSIPYIVLKGKKFLAAFVSGVALFFRHIGRTLWVVMLPMIVYIPVTMLRENLAFLADKTSPEIVGLVLFVGILVGTVIVDVLITIATTFIFLEVTDEKK